MEQMQAFIEKARNDSSLMAKLDELGTAGANAEEIVTLAAEYGFSITVDDYQKAHEAAGAMKNGELAEEELDSVAGGATQNRWDPKECGGITKVEYRCVGFLGFTYCDHYSSYKVVSNGYASIYLHRCGMGRFDHIGGLFG